jgi:hypothetical protein
MNPSIPANKEQVVAHMKGLIAQRTISLRLFEQQKEVKRMRYEIAALDVREARKIDYHGSADRAELVFSADTLEYETSTAQLDMMIEGLKVEIVGIEEALKNAEAVVLTPGMMGVSM